MFVIPINPAPCERPRHNGRFSFNSHRYRAYKDEAVLHLKTCADCLEHLKATCARGHKGELKLTARFERKDRRKVDLDNLVKALCDVLQDAGYIENDSQIARLEAERIMGVSEGRTVFDLEVL